MSQKSAGSPTDRAANALAKAVDTSCGESPHPSFGWRSKPAWWQALSLTHASGNGTSVDAEAAELRDKAYAPGTACVQAGGDDPDARPLLRRNRRGFHHRYDDPLPAFR